MDLVSLAFLLLMIALGGVSAFLADWLAWRIGKRRLTVLNMRPKHFARLTVTVAGTLIPLFTILLVAGASRDVREWIVRGNRALRELPEAVAQLDQSKRELKTLEAQRRELQEQNARSRQAISRQSDLLKEGRNEQTRLGRQIATQQLRLSEQGTRLLVQARRISEQARRVASLASQAKISAEQARSLQEQNQIVRQNLTRAQGLFAKESGRLEGVRRALAIATSDLATTQRDYRRTNERNLELTNRDRELDRKINELQGQLTDLLTQIAALGEARATAQEQTREALAERELLVSQLDQLRDDADRLSRFVQSSVNLTRFAAPTVQLGDELARVIVPAGSSVASARQAMRRLLAESAEQAVRKGAKGEGDAPAVALAEFKNGGRGLTSEEQVELWATRAAGGSDRRILLARSVANFFAGEPVSAAIELYEDTRAFADGTVIADARIDGRRSDGAVYAQLSEFLAGKVNAVAREAKMIARVEDGSPTYGRVETSDLLDLLRTVRGSDRVVRVQAIADGDVRIGDPLRIRLRVQ